VRVSAGQLGYVFGAFLISLLVGLVATMLGRVFGVRLRNRYLVGGTLAILMSFVGGVNALSLLGALLAVVVLCGWLTGEQILSTSRRERR
jgi:hypothetical protein